MPKRFSKQSRKSVGHQNKVFKTFIHPFEVGMKEPFKRLPTYSSLFLFSSPWVITLLKRGFATDFSAIFHNDRKVFTNTNRELKMNKIQLCSQTAIDCNEIKKMLWLEPGISTSQLSLPFKGECRWRELHRQGAKQEAWERIKRPWHAQGTVEIDWITIRILL